MTKMTKSEAGKLGNIKTQIIQQEQYRQMRIDYAADPKLCEGCSAPLSWEQKWDNKYCSHSCAAKVSNTTRVRATPKPKIQKVTPVTNCSKCGQHKANCHEICTRPQLVLSLMRNFSLDLSIHVGTVEFISTYKEFRDRVSVDSETMTIADLANKYGYRKENFHKILKSMGITLTCKLGTVGKLEKQTYKKETRFNIKDYTVVIGFSLIETYGWYNWKTNPEGVSKDHMFSIKQGFMENVPSWMIRHPANCEIILHPENSRKRANCSITLEELETRIRYWRG